MGSPPLTLDQANRIYDILVEECGAPGACERPNFISYFTQELWHTEPMEWRFIGNLGFGGKFWSSGGKWYVSCYAEDLSTDRLITIATANDRLNALHAEYQPWAI